MTTKTDKLIELLQKFADNNVKPAKSILRQVIEQLSQLQTEVKSLRRLNDVLEKKRQTAANAREPITPAATAAATIQPKDNLTVLLWEKFPPIPGSKYHRVHCMRCREPMRASQEVCAAIMKGECEFFCEACDPPLLLPKELALTPRQRTKLNKMSS